MGRALAALAADADAMRKSGAVLTSWALADEHAFADVDGNRPRWGRCFAENFPDLASPAPRTGRRWQRVEARTAEVAPVTAPAAVLVG